VSPPRWDEAGWPWQAGTVRLLPVLHGRLEYARAVRAHLDAFDPDAVVLELPRALAEPWGRAVARLPLLQAIRIESGGRVSWLIPEPCDPAAEATRWALARGREWICGDLAVPRYGEHRDPLPDAAVMPEIGYRAFVERLLARARFRRDPADDAREQALAAAAARAAADGRKVAVVLGLAHLSGVSSALARGAAAPLARQAVLAAGVMPLDPESLAEVLAEPPFVQLAWERARAGSEPAIFPAPGRPREPGLLLRFPRGEAGAASGAPSGFAAGGPPPDPEGDDERAAAARGDDLLARPRLIYRLVQQAGRHAREQGGDEPSPAERRVLHTFARNLALLDGRLCPDLYELVVAARGAVDDRFARDLLDLASAWPWPAEAPGGVRLSAQDLGRNARLVTLRPRIDRLARRPSLREALREAAREGEAAGICSFPPEDLVVEALGADLRERGAARAARAGVQVVPFVASLLDGLDARETLRRRVTDTRPFVREEVATRGEVGAVVVIWEDEDLAPGRGTAARFPWAVSWHGEHQNESDMAFYATDPEPGQVAPGIHRAEYGGFMLTWPPLRLGDIWHDPAYRFCRGKAERLLVAALDYAEQPLVVFVAPRAPRPEIATLARRLGRRIVHLRPGVLSPDRLRRIRTFHVLAGRHLRPLAQWIVPPS
jgi:hypothetical protein